MINALSAHNPLGSVKGTGDERRLALFSHSIFSPFLLSFEGHQFCPLLFPGKVKGQKHEYLSTNAFKRAFIVISVSSIALKGFTKSCSNFSPLLIPTPKRTYCSYCCCIFDNISASGLLISLIFIDFSLIVKNMSLLPRIFMTGLFHRTVSHVWRGL